MTAYRHVYLSPHIDDASLSCGGSIYQQVQAGEAVLVLTVAAATPPADRPLSPFAQQMHDSWGGAQDMVGTRRLEDQRAMGALGVEYRHLQFLDCIYRGEPAQDKWYYRDDVELFGAVHPDEQPLVADILRAVQAVATLTADGTLYAPLGVGNHVDHQLVHQAGWQLHQREGWQLAFYEDYPYVDTASKYSRAQPQPFTLEDALAASQPAALTPRLIPLTEAAMAAKLASIAAYESQLEMLFGGEAAMRQQVQAYAERIGAHGFAERVWLPT